MSFQFQFELVRAILKAQKFTKRRILWSTWLLVQMLNLLVKSMNSEAEFTKNGAYHNASTSDMSMDYVADCADFEWDRIFELQLLSISQPKFNQIEFEAEKGMFE